MILVIAFSSIRRAPVGLRFLGIEGGFCMVIGKWIPFAACMGGRSMLERMLLVVGYAAAGEIFQQCGAQPDFVRKEVPGFPIFWGLFPHFVEARHRCIVPNSFELSGSSQLRRMGRKIFSLWFRQDDFRTAPIFLRSPAPSASPLGIAGALPCACQLWKLLQVDDDAHPDSPPVFG